MSAIKPPWLSEAEKHIGLKEVPGAGNNPTIVKWLTELKAWWRDDLTAWCGTFVAHCLRVANLSIPKHWYRASAYLDWGIKLDRPAYGCIVIFSRVGGGHVDIVVGRDELGRLVGIGGNKSDKVGVTPFAKDRIPSGYRWPSDSPLVPDYNLPLISSTAKSSTNEA